MAKKLNPSERMKIYEEAKGICSLCGCQTRFFFSAYDTPFDHEGTKAGSVDHIIPISLGSTNERSNLRWTCRRCNCSRGNRV